MAVFEKVVNVPPDSGHGTNNQPSWGIQNSNWDLAQQKLDAKADAGQTSQRLQELQTAVDGKASTTSVDNLTSRVQENTTKITEVGNAAKPSALAGAGLQADTAGTKLEVKAGAGLSTQGGAVAVDVAGLAGNGLQADAAGEKLNVKAGAGISTEGGTVAVDVEALAGDGLRADDEGTALEVSIGAGLIMKDGAVAVDLSEQVGPGLEVSAQGLLQISGEFAQEVNSKLDIQDFEGALLEIGNLLAAKVAVSAKASTADIQNGTTDKWVDAAGLKDSRVAFRAVGGVAQTIPFNSTTRVTGLTNVNFNHGNGYSGSQFTAPVAGVYDIKGLISVAGISGTAVSNPWMQILLYKNGVSMGGPYNFSAVRSDGYSSISADWSVELAVGDVLTLYFHQYILNAGVSIGVNANSSFAGHLVR